jgi:nitrite reductase/ring-hydroxylating ferredoxin subunit
MTRWLTQLLLALTVIVLCSCADTDDWISRRYPGRRFFFFYEEHPTSLLFAAYKSPGMYVYVYTKINHGVRHVYVQSNDARMLPEDNAITTERESRAPYFVGANSEIGLIVGCSFFNGALAFDRICPNCTGYQPLAWAENAQHVKCAKCKRTYDLGTGAIVDGEKGEVLMRYGIAFDGTKLYVGN